MCKERNYGSVPTNALFLLSL